LAACTATSPQPQPPAATVTVSPDATGATAPTTSSAAPAASGTAADPQSVITNEPPPGGTVTSNGGPAGPDGAPLAAMQDLIKANRDGFRRCFDIWGKKNPGQAAKIAFQFTLDPDGKLSKAGMKSDEGDLHAVDVESCMITFAQTLSYPKQNGGKPIWI